MNDLRGPRREDLRALFNAHNVALVGATDRSAWSHSVFRALKAWGFTRQLYLVNKRGADAHGLPAFSSCVDIGAPVDAAYVYVPVDAVFDALADVAAAGIRACAVLTSGFAEAGENGAELERKLKEFVNDHGIAMLGPNSLGYVNYLGESALTPMPPWAPIRKGALAIISQSGATLNDITKFAHSQGIGVSFQAATGNEAQIDFCTILDYLIDEPQTRAIAVYAESIRYPERFIAACERAREVNKPIVIRKVGASELTAKVAAAHTGSLVGDDKVFDAVCRQLGVVRVKSIEDLVLTAHLLGQVGPLDTPGIGIVSISGGACTMIADAAEDYGVLLPEFSEDTQEALREVLPSFASTYNPLDVTGAAISEPALFERTLPLVSADSAVGLTICVFDLPPSIERLVPITPILKSIAAGAQACKGPVLLLMPTLSGLSQAALEVAAEVGLPAVANGLDHTVRALGQLRRWSSQVRGYNRSSRQVQPSMRTRPGSEREVLEYLSSQGVAVIPQRLTCSAEEAVIAARAIGGAVALKIASPDIAHKTEVGGVQLGILGDDSVTQAWTTIDNTVRGALPGARIEGILVSPMRGAGIELFVGTTRDDQWGAMLALGLGGIWVEVLKDTALRPLPVSQQDVLEMLGELRGVKLLQGFRGAQAADLKAIAETVVAIGDAAIALGPELLSLEINPLSVDGSRVEALDGLTLFTN